MMMRGLLQWSTNPCSNTRPSLHFTSATSSPRLKPFKVNSATLNSSIEQEETQLTARERRKLRNERRVSKAFNWREEVEERLTKKPKKRFASWMEELNLDNLADAGAQWWVVRVSRVTSQDTAERLARSLARNYPHLEFKVYVPAVEEKRKLKNGSYVTKPKSMFPGCVFLRCVLNKEIHDFVRECTGVGGFVGSRVGNTKRQINRPRPVDDVDMEEIFRQEKEEQERADQAFKDELEGATDPDKLNVDSDSHVDGNKIASEELKLKGKSKRAPNKKNAKLRPGSTVRVLSGSFAQFSGVLKKLDPTNAKATVVFTLFGKDTIADVDIHEIVAETVI